MAKWHNEITDRLIDTIVNLKDSDEAYMFLEDLCTVKEIKEMAQRLQVASLLKQNKSYQEISLITGVSAATISRVSRCLNYGTGGYDVVLEREEK
jgi:TrpR-related protein YerC/YecD